MIYRYISENDWRVSRLKLTQFSFDDRLLHVSDMEDVRVLDDDIIHMNGIELREVPRERDEINRCSLVELEEMVGVVSIVVPLPSKTLQDPLKRSVRRDNLAGRKMDKDLPPHPLLLATTGGGRVRRISGGLVVRILNQPHHSVLVEHPYTRHCDDDCL